MTLNRACGIDHGLQAARRGAEIPFSKRPSPDQGAADRDPESSAGWGRRGQLFERLLWPALRFLEFLSHTERLCLARGVAFFFTADVVDRIVDDLHHMELVEGEMGMGKMLLLPVDESR